MYISKIHIKGYRNFKDKTIEFHEGINVIIGPNNAGKSGAPDKPCGVGRADANPKLLLNDT